MALKLEVPSEALLQVYVGDPVGRILLMILIVSFSLDFPEPGLEGLATSGRVFLREERCLVLRQGSEVLCAGVDGSLNGCAGRYVCARFLP